MDVTGWLGEQGRNDVVATWLGEVMEKFCHPHGREGSAFIRGFLA